MYTVGSLFAGIGGICSGFKQAGFNVIWANEWDKNACTTYRYNFNTNLLEGDINNISEPKKLGKVDIITSGFPCQAFSVAGYRQGFEDEKGRGNLFFETARFIEQLQPKSYLLENVKNLVGHDNGNTFKVIRNVITKDLNYSFIPFIFDSKEYGNIPQTRERIYIVGFRNEGYVSAPLNTNTKETSEIYSEKIEKTKSYKFVLPEPKPLTCTIRDLLCKGKVDDKYYYKKGHPYYNTLKENMKNRDTVYQWRRVYIRENKSKVCPTLTANMGTGGHNVPLIIDDFGIRKLTPKECLAFQGFPSTFKFPTVVANTHLYKQAGNSVVVPVVKRIAISIKEALDD